MKEGGAVGNSKEAEERKKEILDVAEELFTAKGYESTSTTDILERVGIARGTLYYHFKSKEEILDALIERIIQGMVNNIRLALSDKSTALQKLISFVGAMKVDSAIGKEITDYAHKPQNALMHQKIQNSLLEVLTPIAAEIIKEGIKEGIVSTDYPEEAAEILCAAAQELDLELVKASQKYLADKYQADAEEWGYIDPTRWNNFYNWLNEKELLETEIPENTGFSNAYLP